MLLKGNHMAATTITLVRCLTMAALLASVALSPLRAATPDVGLVTGLSGEVTYWNPTERQPPAKAQAFLKIRQGDHFKLSTGAMAQLTYFASGRQETWKGPVTVHVGSAESQAAEKQPAYQPPEVKVLSAKVAKRMVAAPLVVARTGGVSHVSHVMQATRSTGVIPTMAPKKVPAASPPPRPLSPQAQKEVAEAEQVYQDLKKQAKAGDRTPEMYLLSVYAEHRQYQKMEQLINTQLYKQPDDLTLRKLQAWVRAQAAPK
jgi:hypothetical protein